MPQLPDSLEDELSVVLVGNFNPAIFHPEWFRRQGFVSDVDATKAGVNMVSGEIADIVFETLGFSIQVVLTRFVIKSVDVSKGAAIVDLVCNLLAKLPHLPITNVGINHSFHLQLDSKEEWHAIGHALAPKDLVWKNLYANPGMTSIGIQERLPGDYEAYTNIYVQPSVKYSHSLFLLANVELRQLDVKQESALRALTFVQDHWKMAFAEPRRVAAVIFDKILWNPPTPSKA